MLHPLLGGIIGGWEIALILAVVFVMATVVAGTIVIVAIVNSRKPGREQRTPPPTIPTIPTIPPQSPTPPRSPRV